MCRGYTQVRLTGPAGPSWGAPRGTRVHAEANCQLPQGLSFSRPFVQGCAVVRQPSGVRGPGLLFLQHPDLQHADRGSARGWCLPCSAGTENFELHDLPVTIKARTGHSLHGGIPRACRGCTI